jgi:hypothetical protein
MRNVPIHLDYKGRHLVGVADPIAKKDDIIPLTIQFISEANSSALLLAENKVGY